MTKRALIKTAELHRMAKVAKELGVVVEMQFEGVIFRVAPHLSGEELSYEEPKTRAVGSYTTREPVQPPFDHRELFVMELLNKFGVGEKVPCGTIRSFGPSTQKKLEDRGYIELAAATGQPFKDREISLTPAGLADWRALERYKNRYRGLQHLPDDYAL